MQTFLPYPDFKKSAQVLDNKRLGKQRVEASQILDIIFYGKESKWENHPAVIMWQNYGPALQNYLHAMIEEWEKRGFVNTMVVPGPWKKIQLPPWFGHPAFHFSHRMRLYQKDKQFYYHLLKADYSFGQPFDANIPYLWPQTKDHKKYRSNEFYILGQGKKYAGLWLDLQEEYGIKIIVP